MSSGCGAWLVGVELEDACRVVMAYERGKALGGMRATMHGLWCAAEGCVFAGLAAVLNAGLRGFARMVLLVDARNVRAVIRGHAAEAIVVVSDLLSK